MMKYRSALRLSLVAMLALSTTACLSGSGSGSPIQLDSGGSGSGAPGGGNESGPAVSITSPDAAEIDTVDQTMDLGGTASADSGISAVSWQSDKGASGEAEGTESWKIEDIPLETGVNTVTVTVTDASGETGSDTIIINRESAGTGSVTLSWVAPTERTDGTPLSDLAGYRISYGRMSEIYDYSVDVDNPGLVSYVVENLKPGDWYFAVVAYDGDGLESEFSTEAHRKVE